MKRSIVLLLTLFLLLLCLTGCGGEDNISFTATITKLNKTSILVSTTENVGFGSASVDISGVETDFNLIEGQKVLLTIEPTIRESSPVQVTAVSIQLLSDAYLSGTPIPGQADSEIDGVSMTILPGTVTSKGLTLMIHDDNEQHYTYGEWYQLLRNDGSGWSEVPAVIEGDYGFGDIGLMTDESGILTLEIDWQWLYGELDAGSYRIVKALYFDDGYKYFSAEFEIG